MMKMTTAISKGVELLTFGGLCVMIFFCDHNRIRQVSQRTGARNAFCTGVRDRHKFFRVRGAIPTGANVGYRVGGGFFGADGEMLGHFVTAER